MPRISFIYRTDVHVMDRSPISWKGDYPAEIWNNLRQIGVLAKTHEVTAVLDGGDYFHIKAASRNPHSLVVRSAEIQAEYPCPTWCVEGNHDIHHNNLNTVDKQPLGVLYATNTFQHLREQVFEDGDLRIRVIGVPYSQTRTLNELRLLRKKPGDTYLIAIVHALAGLHPPPHVEEFFGESVFRYSDLIFPDGPDVWNFGHWHRDQGIVTLDGCTFVNQGAVSRGALIRENLERTPKVGLLEATPAGLTATSIPLNVLPATEIFDIDRKERQDEQVQQINAFIEEIKANLVVREEDSVEHALKGMTYAEDIRELALHYLENARLKKVA